MVEMSQNLKEVSTGLHGFKELKNFIKLTHDQLKVVHETPQQNLQHLLVLVGLLLLVLLLLLLLQKKNSNTAVTSVIKDFKEVMSSKPISPLNMEKATNAHSVNMNHLQAKQHLMSINPQSMENRLPKFTIVIHVTIHQTERMQYWHTKLKLII